MASSFTWLDYSEKERRKMLDAIRLFKDQDTRDELGIGTIRDAFADLFFPGTGTVQTRARYFLFIPWMYLRFEKNQIPSSEASAKARREELALIDVLAQSEDADGIIGIQARRNLKRLPSNIYWQGLGIWGIRLYPGSQDQYHRSLDSFYHAVQGVVFNDDKDPIDGGLRPNWHVGLPQAPAKFPRSVSFELTELEATYLRDAILRNASATLLAFLVDEGEIAENTEFPWQHHQFDSFPSNIQKQLDHARNFSEIIHGAALLYNLMLAEAVPSEELEVRYREDLSYWHKLIIERAIWLANWDVEEFWRTITDRNRRIPLLTRQFVQRWIELIRMLMKERSIQIHNNDRARSLIREREFQMKKSLARLHNRKSLELWNGAAGTEQLNFRWPVTQRIVRDILGALYSDQDS
jgi:uncharacterized protein DUF6361